MKYLKRTLTAGADLEIYIIPEHIPNINSLNPKDGSAPLIVGDEKTGRS